MHDSPVVYERDRPRLKKEPEFFLFLADVGTQLAVSPLKGVVALARQHVTPIFGIEGESGQPVVLVISSYRCVLAELLALLLNLPEGHFRLS